MIGIDCGCVYPGGRLGCPCLDTMGEFYVKKRMLLLTDGMI